MTATPPEGAAADRGRLAGLGEIAVVALPAAAALVFVRPVLVDRPAAWQAAAWAANVAMVALIWAGLAMRGQGWARLGVRWGWPGPRPALRVALRSLAALAAGLGGFVLGAIVGGALFGVPDSAPETYDYFAGRLHVFVPVLVAVWLASSFGEEVIYRGFLITRLSELWGGSRRAVAGAVLTAGAVFGAAHFTWGPVGMVETAFMGVGLGAAYVRFDRNLWVVVLAHAVMDTVLMVQLFTRSGA